MEPRRRTSNSSTKNKNVYQEYTTPSEKRPSSQSPFTKDKSNHMLEQSAKLAPAVDYNQVFEEKLPGRSDDEDQKYDSANDTFYVQESGAKNDGQDDVLGWFHAKIHIEGSIQWANNFKLQFFMFCCFLGTLAISVTLTKSEKVPVGLFAGSGLTIISCTAVIYSYIKHASWRKHPNPLIFYRSICDLGLVIVLMISGVVKCSEKGCNFVFADDTCDTFAGFTQFFLFASESWFCVMATDMLKSLRSPFTDYKRNIKIYHCFVWGTALLSVILLLGINNASGISEFGYCWTNGGQNDASKTTTGFWDLNIRSWLFFYIWLIGFWAYAICVIIFAWKRLKDGLAETLRMRLRVLHSVTLYVIAIIIYWGLSFIVYIPYLIWDVPACIVPDNADSCDDKQWLIQLMNCMIACKGYFVFVVWFQINELNFSDGLFRSEDDRKNKVDVDVDLSPQVNLALRCEVLYYTTTGIIQAVRDSNHLPISANQQELYLLPQGAEDRRSSLGVDNYLLNTQESTSSSRHVKEEGTLFVDYCPHTFRTIRQHFCIDSDSYIESLSKTTKERLSEGASGAFMFFSHDQQLIVKSMSQEEAIFLQSIAPDYCAYLVEHPNSLLTRFYGCHAIRLYGSTFYFVVMENLFRDPELVIHRRYDIKGSWVNRSAKHPSKGKKSTCRHCNGAFIFGSTDIETMGCPMRVGKHEPNMVLKDNDLTAKVRLDMKASESLYNIMVEDSGFLARQGIMDYSLLLGVHNVEYVVDDGEEVDTFLDNSTQLSSTSSPYDDGKASVTLPGVGRRYDRSKSVSTNNSLSKRYDKGHESINSAKDLSTEAGLPRLFTGTRKAKTVVGPSCYFFGLIDILQTWNLNKRLERFAKVNILQKDPDGVSAIPPILYMDRFRQKMADILNIPLHNETMPESEHEVGADSQRLDSPMRRFL